MSLILHGYWRSGAVYRVRIALALKGVTYEQVSHDLRAGEQSAPEYKALAPQGLVPALDVDGEVLTQSPAILEWIEETWPEPPLLPPDSLGRATVRAMAALIGCDIHPLNNLRVLKAVRRLDPSPEASFGWISGWMAQGLSALETMVERHGDGFCFGKSATLADCYLIPQLYSARRFEVDLTPYPRLLAIEDAASQHPAFVAAHPLNQPDADPE